MYRGDRLCALCPRRNQRPLYTNSLVAIRARHAASWNVSGCTGFCRRPQSAARNRRVDVIIEFDRGLRAAIESRLVKDYSWMGEVSVGGGQARYSDRRCG